jgi:hypothetical protein
MGRSKLPRAHTHARARQQARTHQQANRHTTRATNIFKCTLLTLLIHVELQAAAEGSAACAARERGHLVQLHWV